VQLLVTSLIFGPAIVEKEEGKLLPGAMLRQEELAFIKALGQMKPSPAFLRELRKVNAPPKTTKAPSMKTKRAATLPRAAVQATAAPKRKAAELSGAGALDEPASRRPATGQPSARGSEGHGATGEQAAQSSRQLVSAEGGLTGLRYSGSGGRQSARAKWATHVHSQGLGFRRTRRLP
jgi:hypothetical protein